MSITYSLNNLLVAKGITPTDIAFLLQLRVQTVLSWIRGTQTPTPYNIISVARLFPDYEYEIIDSFLRKQFVTRDDMSKSAGGIGAGFYSFEDELNNLIKNGAWWARDKKRGAFDVDLMNYVVSLKGKYRLKEPKLKPVTESKIESNLIILPPPQILILDKWEMIIKEISERKKDIHSLNWMQFEDFIAHLLENFGWKVENMQRTKDNGIDLIATQLLMPDINFNMMVQCKKFNPENKVGLSIVKEVWSTKWEHGFNQAMIATSSSFTKGAKDKAEKWNLDLRDHNDIVEWCLKYGKLIK